MDEKFGEVNIIGNKQAASNVIENNVPKKGKRIISKDAKIAILGMIVIFFAFIGIMVSLKNIYCGIEGFINKASQKEKFEKYILPVAMFDPVPFDSPQNADKFYLLQSAIWAAFMNNGKNKYIDEEYDRLIVPASDVDVSISMLFGKNINIKHQTFGDGYMNNYIYDENTKTYIVPILDRVGIYKPKVKNILKDGDRYTLIVGYVRPDDIRQIYMGKKDKDPKPEKYMKYELKKVEKAYNILKIKDSQIEHWTN